MMKLSVFLVSFGLFSFCAAPTVTTGDSGEFMTAAATLSFAHPPAYPLYSLMAKAFITALPLGAVPYRVNLFSALCAAAALVFLFMLIEGLLQQKWLALVLTTLIALSRSFFMNALITEVFALNTLLVCAALYLIWRRQFLAAAFLIGLGLGNHQIILFLVPALLYAFWKSAPLKPVQGATHLALAALLGLSVYVMLPLRAQKTPPLNWGNPSTLSRAWRVITRQDYGSLTLSIGEAPKRDLPSALKHMRRFSIQLSREVPWGLLLFALSGLLYGLYKRQPFFDVLLLTFLFSGPFFYWLGNLPFTAQSLGIMGRFMIWPVAVLMLGLIPYLARLRWAGGAILLVMVFIMAPHRIAEGMELRENRLVYDYGNAMLRTLPRNAVLFMDGGDDAFYSLAMLRYVMGRRPDVELHDRGGLIFASAYGPDFRSLSKEQKAVRRQMVERQYVAHRPVYYSTMDENVLPGYSQRLVGFLVRVGPASANEISWPIIVLRGLYPLLNADEYRVRALAVFFPYMQGITFEDVEYFKQARRMGGDVDWFVTNLTHTYAYTAYNKLMANDLVAAEKYYRAWLEFDPNAEGAYGNLGVVLERQGRRADARAQYEEAMKRFPNAADPVYNLGVMSWHDEQWAQAAQYFQETLRRNPKHPTAPGFYVRALQKVKP